MARDERNHLHIAEHRDFTISQYRQVVIPIVSVIWMLFLPLDFYYLPSDLIWMCILLRSFVVFIWFCSPRILQIEWFAARYEWVAFMGIFSCGCVLNVMIAFDTYSSVYLLGLILSHQMGVVLLKVRTMSNLLASFANYGLAIIISSMQEGASLKVQVTTSIILLGFVAFNYIYSSHEIDHFESQILLRTLEIDKGKVIEEELNERIQEEIILRTFPPFLAERVRLDKQKYSSFDLKDAIVGIVDIESSSIISNSVEVKTSWELKGLFTEKFMEEAKKRGIVPLSWTGDGFMFIANFFGEKNWQFPLAALIEVMHEEFAAIVNRANISVQTGLKFGLARGEVIVGHLGSQKAFYNADGPPINLAARLCSEIGRDHCCMTEGVWEDLKGVINLAEVEHKSFIPKGWTEELRTVVISQDSHNANRPLCPHCGKRMFVTQNAKGLTDLSCPRCD